MNTPKITPDQPRILNSDSDKYGRLNLVELVRKSIMHLTDSTTPSVCYGIYGKWGEGKTSFLKTVSDQIGKDNDSIQVIWFSPWMLNSEEALLKDFFDSISKPFVGKLKDLLEKYGELIKGGTEITTKIVENTVANEDPSFLGKIVCRVLRKGICEGIEKGKQLVATLQPSLQERKEAISKILEKEKRHLIIIIDDIDRLDKNEIHAVFRLVRQVADFDNTIYVLSMDQDIVAKSLGGFFGDSTIDGRNFIDKIVQVPVVLPTIQSTRLNTELQNEFTRLFGSLNIEFQIKDVDNLTEILSQILLTPRLIIRYFNQLRFILPLLKNEINIKDLCIVEAIKVINANAYQQIYLNKPALLRDPLSLKEFSDNMDEEIKNRYEKALMKIVNELPENIGKLIYDLLDDIFSKNTFLQFDKYTNKSLSNEIYFPYYFISSVPDGLITFEKINEFKENTKDLDHYSLATEINKILNEYGSNDCVRVLINAIQSDRSENMDTLKNVTIALALSDFVKRPLYMNWGAHSDLNVFDLILNIFKECTFIEYVDGIQTFNNKIVIDSLSEINKNADFEIALQIHYLMKQSFDRWRQLDESFIIPLIDRFKFLSFKKILDCYPGQLLDFWDSWMKLEEKGPFLFLVKLSKDLNIEEKYKFVHHFYSPSDNIYSLKEKLLDIFGSAIEDIFEELKDYEHLSPAIKEMIAYRKN